MKLNYYLAIISIALLGSCNSGSKVGSAEVNGDTIVTESGLKYIYITKGEGKEIERGSEVSAYLGLKIEDSLVWNTDAMPDSLFVFRAGVSTLIQGFTEMAFLLREGDEVVAIMPDSIAYGEQVCSACTYSRRNRFTRKFLEITRQRRRSSIASVKSI